MITTLTIENENDLVPQSTALLHKKRVVLGVNWWLTEVTAVSTKLDPDQFLTSFELCNTTILDEITTLMVPDIHHLRFELNKLNIHAAPGGHFKAHVDTPRSEQMFGSLVVCLPTCFSGDALVTRHHQQEVKFDWSSSSERSMQKLCWAAFFSDVEHEILPVTAGCHITLTYNLYGHKSPVSLVNPTLDVATFPLYRELDSALCNPIFMCDGGVLGFSCHRVYILISSALTLLYWRV